MGPSALLLFLDPGLWPWPCLPAWVRWPDLLDDDPAVAPCWALEVLGFLLALVPELAVILVSSEG